MSEILEKEVQLHERDAQGRDWLVYPLPPGGYPLDVDKGGTGATDAPSAREALGITPTNIGAAASKHYHALAELTGSLSISNGGTGATDAAGARSNLGVTLANLGAAASDHSHALADADITGTLSIAKGGTGATTAAAARNALGLGNTAGAVPIANGGTGQTTVAAARNALGLGNTSGALPLVNGGTGATTAAGVLDVLKQTLFNYQYPVGIIVQLTVSTSPSTLWGYGTWVRIQDVFLLAVGSTYALGATGCEANHALTVDEMPSHQHNFLNSKIGGTGTTQWVWASGGGQNTGAITDTGGGAAHNNMPPYLAVYIWKRTA